MKKIKNLKEKEKAFMEETGVSKEEFKNLSKIAQEILKKRKNKNFIEILAIVVLIKALEIQML